MLEEYKAPQQSGGMVYLYIKLYVTVTIYYPGESIRIRRICGKSKCNNEALISK